MTTAIRRAGFITTFDSPIAVASSGLGRVRRGIEAWASDLAAALHRRHIPVRLYSNAEAPSAAYETTVAAWPRDSVANRRLRDWLPRRLSWRFGLGSAYGVEQVTFALNLIRHLRRDRIGLLHVQDPTVAAVVDTARRGGLVRARVILAHGTEESPDFLRRFRYVQHLAPWHREQLRSAGVDRPTWTAIPNFIDTDRYRPGRADGLRDELGISRDDFVVLCAAAIKRHHKRIDHLIREFARFRDRHPGLAARLIVAGGREADTDDVIRFGHDRLGDAVRFLPAYPRERMPDLYRSADLFALASFLEMMPIALLEATASGLPCVVNRHPVLQWMVGDGGLTIDLTEPGTMAEAFGELAADANRRRRLGELARRQCEANFAVGPVVDRIVAYYECIINPGNGRRSRH